MTQHDNGGPAFPCTGDTNDAGMTLRDYFAAKAMQGIWANAEVLQATPDKNEARFIAALAFEMADAMLKARQS